MTGRAQIPERRRHEVVEFEHGSFRYIATGSRFPDGRLAELFLDGPCIGSGVQIAARDGAILASLALQFGASVETILHALEKLPNGAPAGPIGAAIAMIEAARTG